MKGKSTKKARGELAHFLSKHLCSFGNEYKNIFICPTCLKKFDLMSEQHLLTAGHILPAASNGTDWTLLCKSCNSTFGTKQDKWFSEYLNILNNPNATLLDAKTKGKYIEINGEKVSGNIKTTSDGSVHVDLPINRNPPGKIASLEMGDTIEISCKPELVKHEKEIEVGYITAAYLMWFHEIGYNWVLQSSLDVVRKQILECDTTTTGARVIELGVDKAEMQGVGIVIQSGVLYPCCLVVDKLIIFPAPYVSKSEEPKLVKFVSPLQIEFLSLEIVDKPYLILFDEHKVVLPDRLSKSPPIPELLLHLSSAENEAYEWKTMLRNNKQSQP